MFGRSTLAALAFAGACFAQSDSASSDSVTNNINPTEIASLSTASVLGAPAGTSSAAISYDSSSALAAVQAAVTTAVNAQTTFTTLISAASTAAPSAPSSTSSLSFDPASGNAFINVPTSSPVAKRAEAKLMQRDLTYPLNTKNLGVPSGYTPAFESWNGSTQANGYLTYKTLTSYNISSCAASCNKISSCMFFNIYYEKDPDSNGNPVDTIKCSLYSMPQTKATATNYGQYRGSFHVIISGSNGYNRASAPVAPAGYTIDSLPAAVNAPIYDTTGQSTFIQPVYLDSYDPLLCAAACDKQTAYDKATSKDGCHYKACVYANLYILNKDGAPQTTVCALYTEGWNSTYAVNTGYSAGSDYYEVSNSIGLTNTTAAAIYPQTCQPTIPATIGAGVQPSTFGLMDINWFGYYNYLSFYGNNKAGSLAEVSDTVVPTDQFGFYVTGQSSLGWDLGYLFHVPSGLCLTKTETSTTVPRFEGGALTLATCDASSSSPPASQQFVRQYIDEDWFDCIVGWDDQTGTRYYLESFPDTPATAVVSQYGGWCLPLTNTAS